MLISRRNLREHLPWIFFFLLATAGASYWFFAASTETAVWPGGSSWPGFTFGVIGGVIILFEMLLWPRKILRVWRIGRVKTWMRAHIWLGLLCFPLFLYHSGFAFGGALSTVLMVLLLIVLASGVWGLLLQQFLPQRMLDEVPAETIYSQIDLVAQQIHDEAERLVLAACGPLPGEKPAPRVEEELADAAGVGYLAVGAVRSAGRVQGKVMQTRVPAAPITDAEPLRTFYSETLEPYLVSGKNSDSALRLPSKSFVVFQGLRTKLPPAAHDVVNTLEGLCDQRRQLDSQARMHFWLHSWLCIHLPLSVALVVLMIVHIFVALKYW